jgi:acetyl esterase/lipase
MIMSVMSGTPLRFAFFAFASVAVAAQPPAPVRLWPSGAPGGKGNIGEERNTTTAKDRAVAGRPVTRLTNITDPTLAVYRPPKDKDTGAAVLVFPGGGYRILAIDLEGTEVCDWLNSIGVTGVLVKYRVPPLENTPRYQAPLQDAQRAVSVVRSHAAEWGIDPRRIGVLGFSAGGHLAAAASTNFEKRTYDPQDAADNASCRPDFSIIIYPGYVAGTDGRISPELNVTAATPPAFLVQAEDDGVHVENAITYFLALKNAKVPAEMHLYPAGGHGYGLRRTELQVTTWPARAEEWMRAQGLLQKKP